MLLVSCSQDGSWSNEKKEKAMKNCLDSGNQSAFCTCSVEILTSLFTYEEFYEFDQQIRQGIQPSPAISTRMIEMSKRVYSTCQ